MSAEAVNVPGLTGQLDEATLRLRAIQEKPTVLLYGDRDEELPTVPSAVYLLSVVGKDALELVSAGINWGNGENLVPLPEQP